jgi:excisionase family DNA binding protein
MPRSARQRTLGRPASPWLTLGEASALLGITPGTLRRWADNGDIAAFTTPGGHRRFPRATVEAMLPPRPARNRRPLGLSADRVSAAYRTAAARPTLPWLAGIGEADRSELRDRGRRLVDVLLAVVERPPSESERVLVEAEMEAMKYGQLARRLGASATETVQGFLHFRSPFVGELARTADRRRLQSREATSLIVRAEAALDRLLLAAMAGYAEE